jgi:uncharacterized RDD family membrane protein YckC
VSDSAPLPSFPTAGDESKTIAAAQPYASWGRRAVAYLVDGLVVAAVALAITGLTGHAEPWSVFHFHTVDGRTRLIPYGHKLVFWSVSLPVLGFLYSVAFLASGWRATPGMRWLRIELARAADYGRVGLAQVCGRSAILVAESLLSSVVKVLGLVVLLDFLWPAWDARRQTLHDKLARTVVLRRPPTSG